MCCCLPVAGHVCSATGRGLHKKPDARSRYSVRLVLPPVTTELLLPTSQSARNPKKNEHYTAKNFDQTYCYTFFSSVVSRTSTSVANLSLMIDALWKNREKNYLPSIVSSSRDCYSRSGCSTSWSHRSGCVFWAGFLLPSTLLLPTACLLPFATRHHSAASAGIHRANTAAGYTHHTSGCWQLVLLRIV